MYTNTDGLISKLEKAKLRLIYSKPDIFAIIDTSLSSDPYSPNYCTDTSLMVEGYDIIRKDNELEKKGGILIYIKETIIYEEDKQINKLAADFNESRWIKIKSGNEELLFGTIYRKGTSGIPNESLLRNLLEKSSRKYTSLVICGDFNYPSIDWKMEQ